MVSAYAFLVKEKTRWAGGKKARGWMTRRKRPAKVVPRGGEMRAPNREGIRAGPISEALLPAGADRRRLRGEPVRRRSATESRSPWPGFPAPVRNAIAGRWST